MLFGKNLQRSYKYIMYATKTPSLRIDQSDLKCKSGCGFYGNAQWHGYCSKCHREQIQRQRRAEQHVSLNKSDERSSQDKVQNIHPLAFSKFEEKKLKQSDSLKRNKLLKLNVFRKTSFKENENEDKKYQPNVSTQLCIPSKSLEAQKKDFFNTFPNLNPDAEKDVRRVVHTLFSRVVKHFHMKTIDELSENFQNGYQAFLKRMQTNPVYAEVDSETKELLLDFVEKHVQTYLHNMLFSPTGTDDERADARLHSRIRQLSWVSPQHLDCQIDQRNTKVKELLYEAITELVSMDSVVYPGGKLACIVNCCRSVVSLIGARGGGPASADELLPALIFTVLKANPPRLTSNINFITRFCNAARLMTGEGGYYFTNLCCAVSFIENLTAESLSMSYKEFNCYMKMPSTIGGGSWVAALSLCEGMHEYREQMKSIDDLKNKITSIETEANEVAEQAELFSNEISKKVEDILGRTPLDFSKCKMIKYHNITKQFIAANYGSLDPDAPLHDGAKPVSYDLLDTTSENEFNEDVNAILEFGEARPNEVTTSEVLIKNVSSFEILQPDKLHETSIAPIQENQPSTHANKPSHNTIDLPISSSSASMLKSNNMVDFLSPSLIAGFGSFDTQSVDELITPDEYNMEQFMQGLTNVNYDFDLSDLSGDNSVADDAPINDNRIEAHANTEVNKKATLPCETFEGNPFHIQSAIQINSNNISILDTNDSPSSECLLPSPIKPLNTSETIDKQLM